MSSGEEPLARVMLVGTANQREEHILPRASCLHYPSSAPCWQSLAGLDGRAQMRFAESQANVA